MRKTSTMGNRIAKSVLALCLILGFIAFHQLASAQTFLSASGTKMVNASGTAVVLKGVNLGGWAVQEGYMLNPAGSSSVGKQWEMKKQYYNEGQTDAQVEAFYQSWRNNFITKADIDYIASLGFNCVRLPLHYELFLTSAQRAVRNSVIRNSNNYGTYLSSLTTWCNNNQIATDQTVEAYKMIDNVLNWCGANNMYVIVDMHAAPGGQGTDQNIADALYANNLWTNASPYQDVLNRIWWQIANRYKADPRIAFYDLLNEPNNVPQGGPQIHDLLQKLITTVRNAGDNHMLMIEGNGWGNQYNYLEPYTFSPNWGLVYNAHRYGTSTSPTTTNGDANQLNELGNLINFANKYNVPVFVGETGENNAGWMSANIAAINSVSVGWCHWTYKRFDTGEDAALLRIPGSWPTDGSSVMSQVLNNIQFANNIKNTNTIAAVASQVPTIGSTIWLQNSGKYVNSNNGVGAIACTSALPSTWEKFTIVSAGGTKVALLGNNGKYVSSENGTTPMTCNRASIGGWEAFDMIAVGPNQIAFKGFNGLYVSSEGGASTGMNCNRASVSGWEAFNWAYSNKSAGVEGKKVVSVSSKSVSLYPNPISSGNLTVQLDGFVAGESVRLVFFDLSGKQVYEQTKIADEGGTQISSVSSSVFPAKGLYLLETYASSGTTQTKIIVE